MIKPITPSQVVKAKKDSLPDGVIEAFNELIAEKFDGRESSITLNEAIARVAKKTGFTRDKVCDNGWMDVESIYRKAGWKVEYDQPGYCESGTATYTFSKKRKPNDD